MALTRAASIRALSVAISEPRLAWVNGAVTIGNEPATRWLDTRGLNGDDGIGGEGTAPLASYHGENSFELTL